MSKVRKLKFRKTRVDMNREQVKAKWSGGSGVKLTVPREARDMVQKDKHLSDLLKELAGNRTVCEVGCGYGRMSKLFNNDQYVGVDINPSCIETARAENPNKTFSCVEWDEAYPLADAYLFFTVMLHIPDEEISAVIKRTKGGRVIVSECMLGWFRKYGGGDNFQRDPDEYERLFAVHGMKLVESYITSLCAFPYFINVQVYE